MMLATWLVEFYLSRCNELDDLIASESVSNDVENLRAESNILEEDLRHFFETYKACPCQTSKALFSQHLDNTFRLTLTGRRFMN